MNILRHSLFVLFAAVLLVLGASVATSAQGRGRGGGQGHAGGPPTMNPGVDRGIFTSDMRSNGRAGDGRRTASDKSNGRSDAGIERARAGGKDRNMSQNELNRYRGISRKLGTSPEQLHAQFLAASALNPDLRFGQFVAANVVADNLHSRYPAVTTTAILSGLQNGHSIGQTLRSLRVNPEVATGAEKDAKRQIKDLM